MSVLLRHHRRTLLYLCALLMDMGAFCGYSMLFLVLKDEMGTDLATQGLLPLVQLGVYVCLCPVFNRAFGRGAVSRRRAAIAGATGVAAGYTCIILSRTVFQIAASMWLSAAGAALFWPQLEAEVGYNASGKTLGRRMGLFNLSWSVGSTVAPFIGGILYEVHSRLPMYFAVSASLGIAWLLVLYGHLSRSREVDPNTPSLTRENSGGDIEEANSRPAPPLLGTFVWLAWMGNFVAYAGQSVSRALFQNLGRELGYGAVEIGWLMALLGVTRTLTLLVLQRWQGWAWRARYLLGFQLAMLVGMVCLSVDGRIALPAVGMGLIGAGAAMAYTASIFYSIEGARHGRVSIGLHEAVLGSGGAVGLLLAGEVAPRLTRSDPRSPFHASALLLAAFLTGQTVLASRLRRPRGTGKKLSQPPNHERSQP